MSISLNSQSGSPQANFIVGIGASAGGLQALESFFENLPSEPGATFVVVQHLSPDFRSLMVELLQRKTQLPVSVIEDGMTLALNQVYVLPPGVMVSLQGQQLLLEERPGGAADYPIDHFFLSLAQEHGDRTIGILLSGTGRDGTEGLKAISRAGGIALVQSKETAQFGAMPSNPISSGLVDEILSPGELAQSVYDIIRYASTQSSLSVNADPLLEPDKLTNILDILQQRENIDFSQYKTGTLHRRIVHRLLLSKADTVDQYIDFLAENPDEVRHLRQDLLIGATRFFRDPDMWSLLQTDVLPPIVEGLQPGQPLRLWVAACSTGEEAYSLAIATDEVLRNMGRSHPIKLFATDIDQEALLIASQGLYPQAIIRDIGQERLERYFSLEGAAYRIKKFIRSQVVFASLDLTKNPGFSQMHLVSCRNLLIYMQSSLQEQVLKLLHFSLASRGILVLGPSEHLGNLDYAFQCVDQHWKLYRKRQDVNVPASQLGRSPVVQATPVPRSSQSNQSPYNQMLASVLKLRFGDRPTTCVLVNQNNQTLHIFLNTARLLEFPIGEINLNVLDIVTPSLKLPLSTALHRAKRDRTPVLYSNIHLSDQSSQTDQASPKSQDGSQEQTDSRAVDLWIGEADRTMTDEAMFVVLLELVQLPEETEEVEDLEFDPNSDLSRHVRELEFELQQTRENLQTSVEELETANEEQQATNEELLAANEELQSTNEELQSVNEELYTVNAENQERIGQLTELSSDIDNLLRSTDIGVVFLDQDLSIRKFTPAAAQVFNFRMGDTGRPLYELVNYLDIDNLMPLIEQVAATESPEEVEATNTQTGDRLLLRVLPYRREDGTKDGIVLTLIIINELKHAQDAILQSNQLLEELYRNSPVGLALLDQDFQYLKVNQPLADMNGFSIQDHIGQTPQELLPELGDEINGYFQRVLDTNQSLTNLEVRGTTPAHPEEERTWLASYYPISISDQSRGIGVVITEITKQNRAQAELQRITERLENAQRIAHIGDWEFDCITQEATWSAELYRIFEAEDQSLVPRPDQTIWRVHPDDQSRYQREIADVDAGKADIRIITQTETVRHVHVQKQSVRNANGEVVKWVGTVTDISDRKAAEDASQAKSSFLANMSHELRTPLNSIIGFTQLLLRDTSLSKRQQDNLKSIYSSGEYLLKLINDILNLAKIEAGKLELTPESVNLPALLETVRSLLLPFAAEKELDFHVYCPPEVPSQIMADRSKLKQVLINLVNNAIKFTSEGTVRVSVSSDALAESPIQRGESQASESVCLLTVQVRDTGRGIAQSDLDRIFDAFVQTTVNRQVKESTGLGLSISRQLVGLMGGNLTATSTVGEGSTFQFTIPVQVVDEPPELISIFSDDGQELTIRSGHCGILIVDDNEDNRQLLYQILLECLGDEANVDILEAADGEEAVNLWRQWRPQLIWMDVRMPGLNGYEATQRIRREEERSQTASSSVIIALTGQAYPEDCDRAFEVGCNDFISKPFQIQTVMDAIAKYLCIPQP